MSISVVLPTLAMKVVTTFYRRLLVFSHSFHALPTVTTMFEASVRPLTTDDADAYGAFHPRDDRSTFLSRLKAGFECTAVVHGGEIVHTGWVSTGPCPLPYLHATLVPPSNSVYEFSSYTAPAFRNHGLARTRLLFNIRRFQGLGFSRSIGLVAPENRSGLAAATGAGYRSIGLLGCWQCGPLRWRWQESWTDDPFPSLMPSSGH